VAFTGTGTFYIDLGTPTTWWKKNGVYDWSKQASRGRIMIKNPGTTGKLLLSSRCGDACYDGSDLNQHIPITMSSELIFVAKGEKLACPSDWNTPLCGSGGGGGETTTTTTTTTVPGGGGTTTTTTSIPPGGGSVTVPATATTPRVTVTPGVRSLATTWSHPVAKLFQFRYKADGTSQWNWIAPTRSLSETVSGLASGQRYRVEVRAYVNGSWKGWASVSVIAG
jgi:hypothetical protein